MKAQRIPLPILLHSGAKWAIFCSGRAPYRPCYEQNGRYDLAR
jgi:hypothetical protein